MKTLKGRTPDNEGVLGMPLKRVTAPLAAVLAAVILSPAAFALDRGELTISPSIGITSKAYPAIADVRPNACDGPAGCDATPYAQTQYPGCQSHNGAYCDAVKLNVEKPDGYGDDLYLVRVELRWDRGTTRNKLDLYAFSKPDPAFGPSVVDNRRDENPKVIRIFAPATGPLYMTVVNERGANSGYSLTVTWETIDVDAAFEVPPPSFAGPGSRSAGGSNGGSRATGSSPDVSDMGAGSDPGRSGRGTARSAADNDLQQVELPMLAAGQQLEAEATGRMADLMVASLALGFLVAGGGIAFWAATRRTLMSP